MYSRCPNETHVCSRRSWRPAVWIFCACFCLQPTVCSLAEDPSGEGDEELRSESTRRVLRICADPNNLPFTNDRLEGFENKIAALIARELDADIQYTWRAQRRGFFRESLKENRADLVLGVPKGFEMALPTDTYYRSSYVFLSRRDRRLDVRSLDDPSLKDLKIGVQLVGDDGTNPPAAHALARRGIVENVVGYTVYGDYTENNPPARIVDAVVDGEIDMAIVWGPLAGYFASRTDVPMEIVPVAPETDPPGLRFVFSMAMGVRRGNAALQGELNEILARSRGEINQILNEYAVPTLPLQQIRDDDREQK